MRWRRRSIETIEVKMPSSTNSIETTYVKFDLLRPNARPLRQHSRSQRHKLARAFRLAGGQPIPIITTADFKIIDGHAIYEHLKAGGATEALVTILHSATETDARALRLILNRMVEDTRWNLPHLKLEFLELIELGYDLDATGFDSPEIDSLLKLDLPTGALGEDIDQSEPLQAHPVARLGDIFQMGEHRLGCGDARDAAFIRTVCEGVRADVGIADPPCNTKMDGFVSGKGRHRHREPVVGRGPLSEVDYFALLVDTVQGLLSSVSSRAFLYIFADWHHVCELTAAGRTLDLPLLSIAVWAKSNAGPGSLYRNQHELCCIFKACNEPHLNNVELGRFGRRRSNLWHYDGMSSFGRDRDRPLQSHPTCKPVPLVADILRDVTRRGGAVLDTCCGSGTSIIAAEEVGRRCFATEVDPIYVDSAIRRWQRTTGRDVVHLRTGQIFDDYAQRRLSFTAEDHRE
jgi:hypothetical protein